MPVTLTESTVAPFLVEPLCMSLKPALVFVSHHHCKAFFTTTKSRCRISAPHVSDLRASARILEAPTPVLPLA